MRYSVNGAEKTISLLSIKGGKKSGSATLALEDFRVEPGDIVSLYAVAKGRGRPPTRTCSSLRRSPSSATSRSRSRAPVAAAEETMTRPVSRTDFPAPERNRHGHLEPGQGQGAKGTEAENSAFLSSGAVQTAGPGHVAGRAPQSAPVAASRRLVQGLRGTIWRRPRAEMSPAASKLKGCEVAGGPGAGTAARCNSCCAPKPPSATSRWRSAPRGGGGGGGGGGRGHPRPGRAVRPGTRHREEPVRRERVSDICWRANRPSGQVDALDAKAQ